ncbi:MAG: hypothetical protein ACTHJJ_14135, partial [Intrasporangium sp.]|uniref:hypothetical protein n=1 Tax=Intrasporangium sp. TaxID=1925024 RepID=UPI003F8174C4
VPVALTRTPAEDGGQFADVEAALHRLRSGGDPDRFPSGPGFLIPRLGVVRADELYAQGTMGWQAVAAVLESYLAGQDPFEERGLHGLTR